MGILPARWKISYVAQAHQPLATSRSLSPLYLGVMISVRVDFLLKVRGLPEFLRGIVSTKKHVFFHHFPSANCYDIAIITKAGTDKFGRNLLSAGSRLSKLAGKEAQIQTVKRPKGNVVVRPVMLLSAVTAVRAWGPTLSSLYNTLKDGYTQASQVRSFLNLIFWLLKVPFKNYRFGGHLVLQSSSFSSNSLVFSWSSRFFSSRGTGAMRFNGSTQSACVVYSWVSCSKRDNWRCKACAFDWVRRLISRVLEWTTFLRCGTGKRGIFTESEFHVAIWKDGKPFLLKCLY